MQTSGLFSPDVVAAVMRHMNVDHADDSLVICRALGGQPEATSAVMTGLDADGIDFAVVVDGAEHPIRLLWSERIRERAQIRTEVTRMYREACVALGICDAASTETEHRS
jgi:putative heme iron utilization protein